MQRKWRRKRKLERAGRNSIFDLNAKKVGKIEEIWRGQGEIPYSILMQRKWGRKRKFGEGREKFHIRS